MIYISDKIFSKKRRRYKKMPYLCTAIPNRILQMFQSGLLGAARAEAKLALILPSRDKKPQFLGQKLRK